MVLSQCFRISLRLALIEPVEKKFKAVYFIVRARITKMLLILRAGNLYYNLTLKMVSEETYILVCTVFVGTKSSTAKCPSESRILFCCIIFFCIQIYYLLCSLFMHFKIHIAMSLGF